MKVDGKAIAEKILEDLTLKVSQLKEKSIVPKLTVILVGDNSASLSYIRQKQKAAERIGADLSFLHFPETIQPKELLLVIQQNNNDPAIHGIIVQHPLPPHLQKKSILLCSSILLSKDVDGFAHKSPYTVPVVHAIGEVLRNVQCQMTNAIYEEGNTKHEQIFWKWARTQQIVVIGRGETAGKPIADYLIKKQCTTSTVHSKTPNPDAIIRDADIIISCVGKERVVTKDNIKPGSILISVGILRDNEGKLHGDYEVEEIQDIASFYTPTPGGVGPINVACLMQNLIKAASIKITSTH